jgi:selenocysteine-specific elongation factor
MPVFDKDHVIIGTAGHIDHGKSALVKALTGIDPDTLPEEKERGMTIELGFVFLDAAEYEKQIVFIDVPGHEKFIKTMAAGASSVNAALFVIAADEGISVQTREHFDILRLLGLELGIVSLTKSDLVSRDRLAELEAQVRHFVRGSFLESAPIIPVSAVTGEGIEAVRSELMAVGRRVRKRPDSGIFRMPVDRVFTIHGFGTVIAGTILSGEVNNGDRVEIFPDGLKARVRGIQVHSREVTASGIGKRTALNLMDIKKEALRRGQCAGKEGSLIPTFRLDARLELLKEPDMKLKNRDRVRLHIGTDEVIARLAVLGDKPIEPGESAYVQFVLEAPTVAIRGDRFVIRSFSPLQTLGGGVILDGNPEKHKRFDKQAPEAMKKLEGGLEDMTAQLFLKAGFRPQSAEDISLRVGEPESRIKETAEKLAQEGMLVRIDYEKQTRYLHKDAYVELAGLVISAVKKYFEANPHLIHMPFSDLRSYFLKMGDAQTLKAVFDDLCAKSILFRKEFQVGIVGRELSLKPREQETAGRIERLFKEAGFSTPLEEDVAKSLEMAPHLFKNILQSLFQQQRLVRLSDKVIYHHETLEEAKRVVLGLCRTKGSVTIAELRDTLRLSRKYAQAVLEHFDKTGVTKRQGDSHIPAKLAGG